MANEKVAKFIIDVSAESKRVFNSSVRFFSKDHLTAKFLIQAEKDKVAIPKSSISQVEILFESIDMLHSPNGKVIFNDNMTVESDGLFSYVLPDELLNYSGLMAFEVYISYTNGDKADSSNRIIFEQRISAIDRAAGAVELVYIKDMDAAKQAVADKADEVMADMSGYESSLADYEHQIKDGMDQLYDSVANVSADEITKIRAELPKVETAAMEEITKIQAVLPDVQATAADETARIKAQLPIVEAVAIAETEKIQAELPKVAAVTTDEITKIKAELPKVQNVATEEIGKIRDVLPTVEDTAQEVSDHADQKIAEYDAKFVSTDQKIAELEQEIDEQTEIFNNADVYNKAEIEDKLEPFALQTDIAEVSAQLAQKVGGTVKAKPEDLSAETLGLITGTGGPINLLSIPQDNSVTPEKTTFAYFPVAHKNLFDKTSPYRKKGQYYDISGSLVSGASYNVTHSIDCKVGDVFYTNLNNYFSVGSYGAWFGADNTVISAITVTKFDTYMTITAPVGAVRFELNYHRQNSQDSLMITKNEFPKQYVEYFGNYKYKLNENIIDVTEFKSDSPIYSLNPLFGKTAVWDGDSIANGSSANDGLSGWAGRIMTRNNMTGKNYAKNGATITGGTSAAHQISRNVSNIIAEYPNADYIILEGGANDADLLLEDEAKIGAISVDYINFIDTTFFGAMESTFKQVMTAYPTKKIGFIIAPKMAYQGHGYYNTSKYRKYFDRVIEVCKKWGIPYLDLWYGCHLNPTFDNETLMYVDLQHLSSSGYEYVTPIIEVWMKTL